MRASCILFVVAVVFLASSAVWIGPAATLIAPGKEEDVLLQVALLPLGWTLILAIAGFLLGELYRRRTNVRSGLAALAQVLNLVLAILAALSFFGLLFVILAA